MTRGIRQGCPVSGTVWAVLYDLVVRCLWGSLPRDDLWVRVFESNIALALRNGGRTSHARRYWFGHRVALELVEKRCTALTVAFASYGV